MLLQTKKSEVIFVITLHHLLYILVELNMQENTKKFEVRLNSTIVDKLFLMYFFLYNLFESHVGDFSSCQSK